MVFQLAYSSPGQSPPQQLRLQGRTQPKAGHPSITELPTHIYSNWDNLDTQIHLTCTFLGCGRKLESPGETYTDMGRTCQSTQTVALAGN